MKHHVIRRVSDRSLAELTVVIACVGAALFLVRFPTIPDVGWLIEASRRWLSGGELYRDIIEVNPPLIFYEMVILSGGLLTPASYVAGVCIAVAVSGLWVRSLKGPWLASLAAMLIGGLTDFGQRDHLALIFFIPMLFAERGGRRERIALGVWAFFGIGLKPYFLAMPIAAALARAVAGRSFRPFFTPEMLALAICCLAYVAATALLHPAYLTEIVPLANAVYTYAAPIDYFYLILTAILTLLAAFAILTRDQIPIAAALLGALISFYLQGKYWPYQFVPALGLGILLAFSLDRRTSVVLGGMLFAVQLVRGPYSWEPPYSPPSSLRSMAVLTSDVWPAYPLGLEVRNTTRYPSLWTIPGLLNQNSRTDNVMLQRELATIRADILRERPQAIFADTRNIDFIELLGPFPGYQYVGRRWIYDVWVIRPTRSGTQ